MVAKIREILLTQYIGAILVALLGCQAVITFIGSIVRDVGWYVTQQHNRSLLGSNVSFPWENMIFTLVTIVLYLSVAYFLAHWLYPARSRVLMEDEQS